MNTDELVARVIMGIFLVILIACHGYILTVHLELCDTMAGKLLIINSIGAIVFLASNIVLILLHITHLYLTLS